MPSKRIVSDPDFGQIIIRTHRSARNITMRTKPDGLHVTTPPRSLTSKVLEVIEDFRPRLLENWEKTTPQTIDLNFRIEAPCFRLHLKTGKVSRFMLKATEEETIVFCPPETDFSSHAVQKLIRNAIIRALKKRASNYLPPLLTALAERYELSFKKVKITGSRSRWGSCSATKNINLSYYLMLLPPHLMDYVLLHELAHTQEMNHGPKFWELLNNLTEGQAHTLRNELRKYHPNFK